MANFDQISIKIIKEQELIIGPMAWEEAKKVPGIQVINREKVEISLSNGDPKTVIDKLVSQYEKIFGKASHEVCKDAVKDIIAGLPSEQVPASLK